MTTRRKKPDKVVVHLGDKARKKVVPRTAYTKEHPSPYAFKPGESGNSAGKKKSETRLLSKALNAYLSDRAPEEVAKSLGLPPNAPGEHYNYSWALCLGRRILNKAMLAEPWAVDAIIKLTEPVHTRLDLGFGGESDSSQIMEVVFVESDGDGRISKKALAAFPDLAAKTIEGQPSHSALPAPED
ncbi:MAG TPA: hypothetical protein VGT08_01170 [Terracidiphilus sp.]|nr:hypothetical protein [Terracidiphilus sp.]